MVITGIIAVIAGLVIGLLSGLLGVGGGSIMVPVFVLGFGMSAVTATGTSLFAVIPTALTGAITHLQGKTANLKVGLSMGLGGACAAPAGVWLAQNSPEWLVMVTVSVVIAYSAFTTLRKALRQPKAPNVAKGAEGLEGAENAESAKVAKGSEGTEGTEAIPPFTGKVFAKALFIGLGAGLAGGFVGLGGGFLMIPLMLSVLNFPMVIASGTSLIGVVCISTPGAITQMTYGSVDILTGLLVACGSIPGSIVGARLSKRFSDRTLRFMFAGLLGVAAVSMVIKQFI